MKLLAGIELLYINLVVLQLWSRQGLKILNAHQIENHSETSKYILCDRTMASDFMDMPFMKQAFLVLMFIFIGSVIILTVEL